AGGLFAGLVGSGKDDYGMNAVRDYLRQTFEQVPPAKQKLLTQLELLRTIAGRYRQAIQRKLSLIGNDTNAAEDLQREMEEQASGLDKQLDSTLKEIWLVFSEMQQRGSSFIERNFSVVRALRRPNKEELWSEFEREVIGDTFGRIRSVSEQYANALVDNSRVYWRSVIERLNKMEALLRAEAGTMDAATYADQREALQAAMTMADVQLHTSGDKRLVEEIQANFEQTVRTFTMSVSGSLIGALAVVISIATPGALAVHPLALLGFAIGFPAMVAGGGAAYLLWRRTTTNASKQLAAKI